MLIDLHTHSNASDGTDDPATLVKKAAASGLDVVGLTDHDTFGGLSAAAAAAEQLDIQVVRGVELSTTNDGQSQHLLGYEPDTADAHLLSLFERSVRSRQERAPQMVEKLTAAGVTVDYEAVLRSAGDSTPSKQHVADALVEAGVVADNTEAFDTLLADGGPGYVERWKPTLEDGIRAIVGAGGVAVLAHPWARGARVSEGRFAELKEIGLTGIEVDHQGHDAAAREALQAIARNLGLLVTGASDYHGTRKKDHDLGCNTTSPDVLDAILNLAGATLAPR